MVVNSLKCELQVNTWSFFHFKWQSMARHITSNLAMHTIVTPHCICFSFPSYCYVLEYDLKRTTLRFVCMCGRDIWYLKCNVTDQTKTRLMSCLCNIKQLSAYIDPSLWIMSANCTWYSCYMLLWRLCCACNTPNSDVWEYDTPCSTLDMTPASDYTALGQHKWHFRAFKPFDWNWDTLATDTLSLTSVHIHIFLQLLQPLGEPSLSSSAINRYIFQCVAYCGVWTNKCPCAFCIMLINP